MGSVFVFIRQIENGEGRRYSQMMTVFAEDRAEADKVLASDLRLLKENENDADDSDSEEPAYNEYPAWAVHEVTLDIPKVVTHGITPWTN